MEQPCRSREGMVPAGARGRPAGYAVVQSPMSSASEPDGAARGGHDRAVQGRGRAWRVASRYVSAGAADVAALRVFGLQPPNRARMNRTVADRVHADWRSCSVGASAADVAALRICGRATCAVDLRVTGRVEAARGARASRWAGAVAADVAAPTGMRSRNLQRRARVSRTVPARLASAGERGQFGEELVGGALAAVALDRAQGGVVALLAVGGAGVGDQGHQIAEVAGVAHRALDALLGE